SATSPSELRPCHTASSNWLRIVDNQVRICWCGGGPSNGGMISRTSPRTRRCGGGARRKGSNTAETEGTLVLSTDRLGENAGYAGRRIPPPDISTGLRSHQLLG